MSEQNPNNLPPRDFGHQASRTSTSEILSSTIERGPTLPHPRLRQNLGQVTLRTSHRDAPAHPGHDTPRSGVSRDHDTPYLTSSQNCRTNGGLEVVWSAQQHLRPVEELLATEVATPNKIQPEVDEEDTPPSPTTTVETSLPDSDDETKNPLRRFIKWMNK